MKKRIQTTAVILAITLSLGLGIYFFWPSYKDHVLAVHGVSFSTMVGNQKSSFFIPTSVELNGGDWVCDDGGFKCHDIDLGSLPPGAIPTGLRWENCNDPDYCPEEQWCLRGSNGEIIQTVCSEFVSEVNDGGTCTVVICDVIDRGLIANFPEDLKQIKPDYLEDLWSCNKKMDSWISHAAFFSF